jgi:hypothetical protein
VVQSFNGVGCKFLTLYDNVVNGEQKTTTPKWVGVSPLITKLDQFATQLQSSVEGVKNAATDVSWYDSDTSAFKAKLNDGYNQFWQSTLTNPNPANSLKNGVNVITPIYISRLGSYEKVGADLNLIYAEYNTTISVSVQSISTAQQSADQISKVMQPTIDAIRAVSQSLGDLNLSLKNVQTDVIDKGLGYKDQFKNVANNAFLVLFAFILAVSAFLTVTITLVVWCCNGFKCLRFILHLIWNLLYLITILTFIVGAAFGVVGVIATDSIPVLNYVLSTTYLNSGKLITDANAASYIDTCFNGNGDLSQKLNLNSGYSSVVIQLADASLKMSTVADQIKNSPGSYSIQTIQQLYTNMTNDITLTTDPTLGNNAISSILTAMDKWTNADFEGSYQKSCSSNTRDIWVQSQSMCSANYPFLAAGGSNVGSKNCLTFTDWSASQESARYNSDKAFFNNGSSDFTSTSTAINSYYNGISKYITDNTNLIGQLNTLMSNINDSFKATANKLLGSLTNINSALKPLTSLIVDATGANGFVSMINCGKIMF